MFFLVTKKELKKERDKIRASFKKRDLKFETLKEKVESNSLKIATLEGAYSALSSRSRVSVSRSLKGSQTTYETKLINKIRKSKRSLIMAEMLKLIDSHSSIEMFDIVVREKGLCSKASFYRYLERLKSQRLIENENKVRQTN